MALEIFRSHPSLPTLIPADRAPALPADEEEAFAGGVPAYPHYGAIEVASAVNFEGVRPMPDVPLQARRVACGTLFSLFGFVYGHFFSQLPTTKERLAVPDPAFGSLLLADDVGGFVALYAAKAMPERLARSGAAPGMGALVAAAAGATTLARNPTLFAAALGLFGIGSSLFDVAANVQFVDLEAMTGRVETSMFHGLFSAGQLIGSTVGATLTRTSVPFEVRGLAVAACLVAAYLLHSPFMPTAQMPEAAEHPEQGEAPVAPAMPRAVYGLAALGLMSSVAEGAASEWVGIYLRQNLGADVFRADAAAMAYAGGMTVSRLGGGWAAQKWGSRAVLTSGSMLTAAMLAAALWARQPHAMLAAVAAVGAGLANTTPLTVSAAGKLSPTPGPAVAAITLAQQLGFFSGPPLIGGLAGLTSLPVALGLIPLVGTAMLATSSVVALPPKTRTEPHPGLAPRHAEGDV